MYDDEDDDFDIDDYDDYDECDDLECSKSDDGELSDYDIEMAGSLDAQSEDDPELAGYANYGLSIDLDDLTDEQRDLYDDAYHASKGANEG